MWFSVGNICEIWISKLSRWKCACKEYSESHLCTPFCTPFSKPTKIWSFIFHGIGISSLQCQFSSYLSTGLPVASDATDQWKIVGVHFKVVYFHFSYNQDAIPTVFKLEISMPNGQRKSQGSGRLKRLKINMYPKFGGRK